MTDEKSSGWIGAIGDLRQAVAKADSACRDVLGEGLREVGCGVPRPPEPACLMVPLVDAPGELRLMAALSWLAEQFRAEPGSPTQPAEALSCGEFERAVQWFATKYAPERPF
jgi:hypothetical protein